MEFRRVRAANRIRSMRTGEQWHGFCTKKNNTRTHTHIHTKIAHRLLYMHIMYEMDLKMQLAAIDDVDQPRLMAS